MPRLILLLIVIGFVWYLIHRYNRLSDKRKKQTLRLLVLGLGVGFFMALALTGKLSWVLAALGAMLALVPRMLRLFVRLWPALQPYLQSYFQRYQQNRQSSMHSRFVGLKIDMLTGKLQGEILAGEYAGESLQSLAMDDLLKLLEKYKADDPESAALLAAYLDGEHAGWAEKYGADYKQAESDFFNDSEMGSGVDSEVNAHKAREILGLTEKANKKEIIKAHKRLMQKLHPDRGGSDYLAQQINKARDVLLKNIE